MKHQTSRLTKELLSLYIRYGPEEFEAVARELREGNLARLIADAVDSLDATVKTSGAPSGKTSRSARAGQTRPSKGELMARYLAKLAASGANADAAIAQFAERIAKRDILETTAALREYMTIIGMPMFSNTADRYQNIKHITEFLKGLPEMEAMEKIRIGDDLGGRRSSLQQWADIIVKPGGR